MTPAQEAYLTFLTSGDWSVLKRAKITAATAKSCLRRGWTEECEEGNYLRRPITPDGMTALFAEQLKTLDR